MRWFLYLFLFLQLIIWYLIDLLTRLIQISVGQGDKLKLSLPKDSPFSWLEAETFRYRWGIPTILPNCFLYSGFVGAIDSHKFLSPLFQLPKAKHEATNISGGIHKVTTVFFFCTDNSCMPVRMMISIAFSIHG